MANTCVICIDELNPELGENYIACISGHALCITCFTSYTTNDEFILKSLQNWHIHKCISCPCCEKLLPARKEIQNNEILQLYVDAEIALSVASTEVSVLASVEKSHSSAVAVGGSSPLHIIYGAINNIADTSKRCPYCNTVFYDFSGCMALSCISCNKNFCGYCLKVHKMGNGVDDDGISIVRRKTASSRCHEYVSEHNNGSYFMNIEVWHRHIRDTIIFNTIKEYLLTMKKETLYEIMDELFRMIEEEVISEPKKKELNRLLCSNQSDTMHMLRLPAVFATIYSAKRDIPIEQCIAVLSSEQKKQMGVLILKKIKDKYKNWQQYTIRVPGESYNAISYPTFMYDDIYLAIEEWGATQYRLW